MMELLHLLDAPLLEVHERAAEKLGIFYCGFVSFRSLDVGLHDFQVTPGEISSEGGRWNQVSPRVPSIH